MDDKTRDKLLSRLLDDRSIEYYVSLAGKKAIKTDTRAVANDVIPLLLDQLDSKATKDTKTADKLHEYMLQAFEPGAAEDPKYGSAVLTALLSSKKNEIIAYHADSLLVHPIVIENMLIAMAPQVMAAYGKEFGKDIFRRGLFGGPKPPAPPKAAGPSGAKGAGPLLGAKGAGPLGAKAAGPSGAKGAGPLLGAKGAGPLGAKEPGQPPQRKR